MTCITIFRETSVTFVFCFYADILLKVQISLLYWNGHIMRRLMHIGWFIQKKKSCIYGIYDFAWNQCSSALDLSEWWRVAKSWCVSPFWEKLKLSQYFAFFGMSYLNALEYWVQNFTLWKVYSLAIRRFFFIFYPITLVISFFGKEP